MTGKDKNANRRLVNRQDGTVIEFVPFPSKTAPSGEARYRDPANPLNTWSGWGQRPAWLVTYLDEGRQLEEFRIPDATPITRPSYCDPENQSNIWSGFGRRPGWLTAYLKAGRTLDEFEIRSEDEKGG
ncbi:H-NS family nucleoid-associated regulatory protein [Pandoraea oxalativorans]|uniref:H-NS histone family protein n=1 Tax=Pandoraea oxalativorans TaxID=573737 RepID=UPI001FE1350A|nr:H-NS histone family protein [Pandoraea oxalativorans]